jgi:hypothetical protein
VESQEFLRGHDLETEWISSDVTVTRSAADADRVLQTLRRPAGRRCLAQLLKQAMAKTTIRNARWGPAAVYGLPVPAPWANVGVGMRIALTMTYTADEVTMPAYIDVLWVARGPASLILSAMSVTQPVPAEVERQILSTLLARASSHKL